MGNSFGRIFRLTTFGESHGAAIGGIIDGCPAGLELNLDQIQLELDRRKPGQSEVTTQRKESDVFRIFSGLAGNITLGTPIGFSIPNEDQKESDYDHLDQVFRPSHADFTWFSKFGIRDHRGGGRSSARETASRVFAGAVAKQFLTKVHGIRIHAWVSGVGNIDWNDKPASFDLISSSSKILNCPNEESAKKMLAEIQQAKLEGDSLGGRISCIISNFPAGLVEPVFDKTNALLAHALMSINAVKGLEFGSGFDGSKTKGSENNDEFISDTGKIHTKTNRSGGIQGGITNGEEITFRLAFKPTSTIMKDQQTVNTSGESVTLSGKGRHDPCVVPRAVPIVEAMAALVLADLVLLARGNRLE